MSIATEITRLQNAKAALKESIEAKGVTVEDSAKLDEYPALVDTIPQGGGSGVEEKDVNFYDYDGTCVYSYTKDEFLALSEMPANPDHSDEGLISDGWNWDYEDAINYVSKYGLLIIGNVIRPNNCDVIFLVNTFIYNSVNFYLSGCTIDWGDGNIENYNAGYINHTYSEKSNYMIKCTFTGNSKYIGDGTNPLCGNDEQNIRYFIPLVGVILSKNVNLNNKCFTTLIPHLKFVTFPDEYNYTISDGFTNMTCYSILILVIPKSFTYGNNRFAYGISPKIICMSNVVTAINDNFTFSGNNVKKIIFPEPCTQLKLPSGLFRQEIKVIIPENVTSLTPAWYSAALEYYIYPKIPPTLNGYFARTNTIFKIYVPAESVEDYKAATNWSNYADKIFPIPTE